MQTYINSLENYIKFKNIRLNESTEDIKAKINNIKLNDRIVNLKKDYDDCKTDECRIAVKKEIKRLKLKQMAFMAGVYGLSIGGIIGAKIALNKYVDSLKTPVYSRPWNEHIPEIVRPIPTYNPNRYSIDTRPITNFNRSERREEINKKIKEYVKNKQNNNNNL